MSEQIEVFDVTAEVKSMLKAVDEKLEQRLSLSQQMMQCNQDREAIHKRLIRLTHDLMLIADQLHEVDREAGKTLGMAKLTIDQLSIDRGESSTPSEDTTPIESVMPPQGFKRA